MKPKLLTQHAVADELIDRPDIQFAANLDLYVACAGPEFNFRVEVQRPSVFRGPHIDRGVRQRIHLHFLATKAL